MNEKSDFALVRKPTSTVEKAAPGAKRVLAGMVAETIVLAETKALIELSPNKSPLVDSWCKKAEDYLAKYNYVEAERWFRMAADKGHAWSQYRLSEFASRQRDYIKAEKWVRRAAEQGLAEAQDSLARRYTTGIGVPKDDQEALRWLNKAAEQGFAHSQHYLARFYMAGRGVPQDYHKAILWLTKAAEQNHEFAKLRIAECYQALDDLVEAFKWLMLASDQNSLWEKDLNLLRPLLTKEQIAEAEKRYCEFQSSKK